MLIFLRKIRLRLGRSSKWPRSFSNGTCLRCMHRRFNLLDRRRRHCTPCNSSSHNSNKSQQGQGGRGWRKRLRQVPRLRAMLIKLASCLLQLLLQRAEKGVLLQSNQLRTIIRRACGGNSVVLTYLYFTSSFAVGFVGEDVAWSSQQWHCEGGWDGEKEWHGKHRLK